MKTIHLLASLAFTQINALAWDARIAPSPQKQYECRLSEPGPNKTGMIVIFKDIKSKKEIKLLETDRWAEVVWSPMDNWFAIADHMDGQASSLSIYQILSGQRGDFVSLKKQYTSPGWGVLGVEWSIQAWMLDHGAVKIKRTKVIKDNAGQNKHRSKEVYTIPLE